MQAEAYQAFTEQLKTNLQADERVQGLVLLGSTASQSRQPDEWSDHDFFVITDSGLQEDFRTRFDWLPDHESIVLTVRETQHGLKVLYANGHLLEYAVFDVAEIGLAKANDYAVVFDRSEIRAAMQKIAVSEAPIVPTDTIQKSMDMFLCLLVVGAGRVARGEAISGQVFIRTNALHHLLMVLVYVLDAPDTSALDNLDVYRRFEQVFPEIGKEINSALAADPMHAAHSLLALYERELQDHTHFSIDAVQTVRNYLSG